MQGARRRGGAVPGRQTCAHAQVLPSCVLLFDVFFLPADGSSLGSDRPHLRAAGGDQNREAARHLATATRRVLRKAAESRESVVT